MINKFVLDHLSYRTHR